jgi:hypothetical protein
MGLYSVANSRRNYYFPAPGDLSMGQMGYDVPVWASRIVRDNGEWSQLS